MKILDIYIGRAVILNVAIVLMVLLSLFGLIGFMRELEDIGKGRYEIQHAGLFILMSLPGIAYMLFPMATLLGSIIGLGGMANNSELIVIRAAGVSIKQIVFSVLKVGLLLMIVATIIGEFLAPISERYAMNMRSTALGERVTTNNTSNFWAKDGQTFIKINNVFPDGDLGGIHIYQFNNHQQLQTITQAKSASYINQEWLLKNIKVSALTEHGVIAHKKAQTEWKSLLNPQLLSIVTVNPNNLSATGIYNYVSYLKKNGLDAERYQLALWKKVAAPLNTGVMLLLSIPFIFASLRTVSIGQRILFGALVGLGFHLFGQIFSYAGLLNHYPPVISALLPTLLFFILSIILMRRMR